MTYLQALLLGIVQGLTEFLPISSSGHLVLVQHLFGLHGAELSFDVSVHVGTLAAVIIFFRKDILQILSGLLAVLKKANGRPSEHDSNRDQARLAGRLLRAEERQETAGPLAFAWNGTDGGGKRVPPGLYIVELQVRCDAREEVVRRIVPVVY